MLTSVLSTTTTTGSVTGIQSMTTTTGIPEYGVIAVIMLITLLSAKFVLSASAKWSKSLDCTLKMAITPLIIEFVAIVVFKLSHLN
ncbi:hypothetical protein [Methanolobus halotolerans]|uniref:Uncharacterized protein n=1 Tax=Methanolobus halotolerans TaxID=2052935 RepID=A0A4E0PYW3_9EURY|nr:hypothetical protein [Methanolobus halotolerans]TGC10739.1 hypothetical protein CUN85_03250 [Methanolobus halotolerans]